MIRYYVTVVRGRRVAYLAGPFDEREIAEMHVTAARDVAIEVDPWAWFDAFGVTEITTGQTHPKRGTLMDALGL